MITQSPQPAVMTAAEWQAEGRRRFGVPPKWKFQCPICGRVFSLFEVAQCVGPERAQIGTRECIGRVNGKGFKAFGDGPYSDNANGCDYAAYGLFTSGFQVIAGNHDTHVHVLPFAEPVAGVDPGDQVISEPAQPVAAQTVEGRPT